MRFGSLFSGIGGFDLGLERAGLTCAWQVEIDDYARRVLAKHWPRVRRWDDVRTFPPEPRGDWDVDLVCGGFPCQNISVAGLREGIDGAQSALWVEFERILGHLRPRFALVENVPFLARRGLGRVLGDLAALGYDTEWGCVSAAEMGAPHRRERLFVLAYTHGKRLDACSPERRFFDQSFLEKEAPNPQWVGNPWRNARGRVWLAPASGFQPMADGFPTRVDEARLSVIGQAIVPDVAEWIGRRLMDFDRWQS